MLGCQLCHLVLQVHNQAFEILARSLFEDLQQDKELFARGEQLLPARHSHGKKGNEDIDSRASRRPEEKNISVKSSSERQDRIFTFLGKKKPQPEQFFGQDQQLLPLLQVPSGSCHYSEREMLKFYLFSSFVFHLYKKVEPANSDCFVDEMAALGTLKTIGIVHQVWQVELGGKQ